MSSNDPITSYYTDVYKSQDFGWALESVIKMNNGQLCYC